MSASEQHDMTVARRGTLRAPLVAFAGGGSGGHLYPALSVAEAMQQACPDINAVFLISQRPIDRRVLDGTDAAWITQSVQPARMQPWQWPGIAWNWRRSAGLCRAIFDECRPRVVLASGGFASVPAVGVARRMGIPVALFNPDATPGRASRYLASKVDRIFVQWPSTVASFGGSAPVRVTGCPVRAAFRSASRDSGIRKFDLDPSRKTLLVTGASQGARAINELIVGSLDELGALGDWQILHLTGEQDFGRVSAAYQATKTAGRVLDYTDALPEALAAADLVVTRAGASTLAELTAIGRASLLVPYPHHRDRHQTANAEQLAGAGAACIVEENPAGGRTAFLETLLSLMSDKEQRERMADSAARLGKPDAAAVLGLALIEMSGLTSTSKATTSNGVAA